MPGAESSPDWERLYQTASSQQGYFTTQQAAVAGYSPQLLVHHVRAGKLARERRSIYRLVHFPTGDHEDLVAAYLWSELAAVVSHQSALALHQLSDALPARIHLTLPNEWRRRRLRSPANVVVHHADVPEKDRSWFGAVPTTSPQRTLNDCATSALSPDLLRQAAHQALRRGLVTLEDIGEVLTALRPFGGLGT